MLTERFDRALVFASNLHRTQNRKGTAIPYISHLLSVAALVLEDGGDEDEAIAALLHDSIEDAGSGYSGGRAGLRRDIERQFGPSVLAIVNACTDDEGYNKASPEASRPEAWRLRKQAYLDRIRHADHAARRLSCADKLHNARCLLADCRKGREAVWARFRTGRQEDQLWYYSQLARLFRETQTGPLADELNRVVAELRQESGGLGAEPAEGLV